MNNRCNAYDENKEECIKYCNDGQDKEIISNEPTRVLLKCGNSGGVIVLGLLGSEPENAELIALGNNNTGFNLASVSVDTRGFSNPNIKIEFACNIAIMTFAAITDIFFTVNFQLYKLCSNQLVPTPVGTPWTYSTLFEIVDQSDAFTFSVCDHSCENECCNYIVTATFAADFDVTLFTGVIEINNATLTAMAVDSSCNC